MPGLVPGIHVFVLPCCKVVDGRVKPGHDVVSAAHYSPRYAFRTSGLALISADVPCICKRPV